MAQSIIGKLYLPSDNSYSVNLTSCSNYSYKNDRTKYLAGAIELKLLPKEVTIISEPFLCKVNTSINTNKKMPMILVKDSDGDIHSTLFYEKNINRKLANIQGNLRTLKSKL